jgi:hypothetical protein
MPDRPPRGAVIAESVAPATVARNVFPFFHRVHAVANRRDRAGSSWPRLRGILGGTGCRHRCCGLTVTEAGAFNPNDDLAVGAIRSSDRKAASGNHPQRKRPFAAKQPGG